MFKVKEKLKRMWGNGTGQENGQAAISYCSQAQAQEFDPRLEAGREQVLLQVCFGGRNYACFTILLAGLEVSARERYIAIARSKTQLCIKVI